jgi:alpha/beta superfamily hydrolase
MREEKVFIPSGSIRLEGLLSINEALPVQRGVICCHPHPQYGGDMENSVITSVVEIFSQEGFSTLRFNFRGVAAGHSIDRLLTGHASERGFQERSVTRSRSESRLKP